jgi:NAD(P)-dependent dehydrogenase (short-subunit alcohol dehydrogenase family)
VELEGKVALVTGGARRLGRQIALALAERGAELVVHYRESEGAALELLAELKRMGGKPVAVQGDLALPADVERIVETGHAAFGRIDVLVNSASVFTRTPLEAVTVADWDHVLAVNLRAPFFLCQRVAVGMRRQGRGKIINLADIGGSQVWVDYLPYCLSKAGLLALTRGLAKALAPTVQVNAIAPGVVLLPDESSDAERQRAADRIPLGRLGTPEDVVRALLYLVESDFATGEVLTVDGGQRLRG